jgi:hypothetical protein
LRKSILVSMAVVVMAGSALGAFGDLVASFHNQPSSGTSTHYGLAADATYLYSYYYSSPYNVYRMLRSNGSLVSSYPAPLGTGSYEYYMRGACYDGTGYIYWINYYRRYVGRARASNGSLVSTWTWPTTEGYRYGIATNHTASAAGNRIYTNYYTGDFWTTTLTGSLVSSWSMPYYTYNYDSDWDWNNNVLWAVNYSTDWIYGLNVTTHTMVHSFRHPKQADISSCYGIAYWPPYLYVSNSGGTPDEYIWVFHCPNNLGVAPASVGKVKALFR